MSDATSNQLDYLGPLPKRDWLSRVKRLSGTALGGNGLALVMGSAITAVFGLVFWLVVARSFSQAQVGVGAALIAAMMALSHAAQLNLRNLVHRYVPTIGSMSDQLIHRTYWGAGAAALALGSGFVLLAGRVSPELSFLSQSVWMAAGFIVALVIWTLYALQEAVLTGLRLSRVVPMQSLIYSVLKIGAVGLATFAVGAFGFGGEILVAIWVVPAALIGLFVYRLIQGELASATRQSDPGSEALDRAAFWRFFGWDYAGSLSTSVALGLIPMLVLSISGAAASAQYQMAWTISYSLYLVGRHLGAAMQAEIGKSPARRRALYATTMLYTLALVTPAVTVTALFAPQIMGLFGTDYVAEGSVLLRILAMATLPLSAVTVVLAIARAENQFAGVAGVQVSTLIVAVGLGVVLLQTQGPVGMAWAWLLTHTMVLGAVLVWTWMKLGRAGMSGITLELIMAMGRTLRFGSELLRSGRAESLSDACVELTRTVTKRAKSVQGKNALELEYLALLALHDDPLLEPYRHLIPAAKRFDGNGVLEMTRVWGREGRDLDDDGVDAGCAAAQQMAAMHSATASIGAVNQAWIADWIDMPLSWIPLAGRLRNSLRNRLVRHWGAGTQMLGLGHGDFCLDNLIFEEGNRHGEQAKTAGIIDWGQCRFDAPEMFDPLHLVLTMRMRASDQEFGQVVKQLLVSPDLDAGEAAIVGKGWNAARVDERQAQILLVWLHHVTNNMRKSKRYQRGGFWFMANVQTVVRAIEAMPEPDADVSQTANAQRQDVTSKQEEAAPSVWRVAASWFLLFSGFGLWAFSLPQILPDNMGPLGLISILPNAMLLAYAVTIAGFALSVSGSRPLRILPTMFLLALVMLLHATPALSYETLRYSWAWKHVGVIDFIMRTGELDPTAQFLSAYFNWPTFFLAMAGLGSLFNLDPLGIADLARFYPVLMNIGFALALLGIFRNLRADRRTAYVGTGLFLMGNWVGQDYFSPQGTAFLFYLCLIYLVTGPLTQETTNWRSRTLAFIATKLGLHIAEQTAATRKGFTAPEIFASLVLVGLIITTHQLTPLLTLCALFGLFAIGRLDLEYFLFGITAQLLWLFYFADGFMASQLLGVIESFGAIGQDTVGRLVDLEIVSDSQRIVSLASRTLSASVVVLGILGGLLRLWRRQLDLTALVLLLSPVPLMIATPYGGEVVFRAYFFALPFISLFAASVFTGPRRMGWIAGLALCLVMSAMVPGFILANNGKDQQYRFTAEEVVAADWLYGNAKPGELLIEGARSYPSQFRNYENFIYVPLSEELPGIAPELTGDPAGLVTRWLTNAPNGGYLIITRSMKAMFDSLGLLPAGGLERVEQALFAAPQLKVAYSNADAVVFTLRD